MLKKKCKKIFILIYIYFFKFFSKPQTPHHLRMGTHVTQNEVSPSSMQLVPYQACSFQSHRVSQHQWHKQKTLKINSQRISISSRQVNE